MLEHQILSGNGRRSPLGRTRPSTIYFNDLLTKTMLILNKSLAEYITLKHTQPSSVLDVTLPESWDKDTINEKSKYLSSCFIHYAHSAGYEFLYTDNSTIATSSWISENIKNLLYRNHQRDIRLSQKHTTDTNLEIAFDPQRNRTKARSSISDETTIENWLMLPHSKKIIYRLFVDVLGYNNPRAFQIDSVNEVMNNNNNLLLIRKTGEGKSAVLYGCCCLENGVVICATPLIGLSAQQSQLMHYLSVENVYSFHLDLLSNQHSSMLIKHLLSFRNLDEFENCHDVTIVLYCSPVILSKGNIQFKNSFLFIYFLTHFIVSF